MLRKETKTVPLVFYSSAKVKILVHVFEVIIDMMETLKNNLRTVEAKIVQKLKNEPGPKFTGSFKKSV